MKIARRKTRPQPNHLSVATRYSPPARAIKTRRSLERETLLLNFLDFDIINFRSVL